MEIQVGIGQKKCGTRPIAASKATEDSWNFSGGERYLKRSLNTLKFSKNTFQSINVTQEARGYKGAFLRNHTVD